MGSFHRNEKNEEILTKMESKFLIQKFNEEETGITTVIAQAEAEQCQEFCPSSVKHGLLQPHRRRRLKTLQKGKKRNKGHSEFMRTTARKISLKMETDRQVPIVNPYSRIMNLSARKFKVSGCSDIYTSVGGSPKLSSQLENSAYIYAESVKGFDTSCSSVSQDWGSLCRYTEIKKTWAVMRNPGSNTGKIGSSIEALFGSDTSCDGESVRGDYGSDSSCVNADWEQSFDSDDDSCSSVYSFAEAQWGSASSCSAASGYTIDCDLEPSFSYRERQDILLEAGHCDSTTAHFYAVHSDLSDDQFEMRYCDSAYNHFEGRYHDLPVSHFKPRHQNLPVSDFDARGCDSVTGHFEAGHHNLPVGHFEAGFCDSVVSHFEAGYCNSPNCSVCARGCDSLVGHCESGHYNSPVGHFEAGHRDLLGNDFDKASFDLYNACPENSDAVSYMGTNHNSIFNFKDGSQLLWQKLEGVVTHPDCCHVAPFFHKMMTKTEQDGNEEKGKINKGFLFHPRRFLQAKSNKYRESQEYTLLHHVQNGSYGDVFSMRDKQTGFTCAAKKIPLSTFSWEEVGTWSRLDSPRVLQLYGVVRDGLNVVLFMDLKTGSLAELLKARGHFPEDLALYYHCQVLQALEHLHSRKVIHLDVKVDNVLLSIDKSECFLCDFGLSELLDQTGYSTKTFRGNGLRGTESHMSPEVARGDPHSDKADVWSSCCMLLHMLSGHQPWTRYYTPPLCLKIVSEPAPLWEIPSSCDTLTHDVIRGGLVKPPRERDSARELLEKSSRALRAVGGLFETVQTSMLTRPQISPSPNVLTKPLMVPPSVSNTTIHNQEELSAPRIQWISGWRERAAAEDGTDSESEYGDSDGPTDGTKLWMETSWRKKYMLSEDDTDDEIKSLLEERWVGRNEEEGESDEEMESDLGSLRELGSEDEWEPFCRLQIVYGLNRRQGGDEWSEKEDEYTPSMLTRLHDVDVHETSSRLGLTCHRSVCTSDNDFTDKASDWSDDLSSGVFSSYSSLPDEQSFNVDWSVSTNQPPSCSFEGFGVDIWVEDVNGDTFRIRERRRVKLGHVAIGISAQISIRAFSLATLDGKLVSPDTEALESRMWLLCVPAPDNGVNWTWRIRNGKMETQEADRLQSDTCSTLAAY